MNLPKPMQHHSLQPRPQHIRHPMHQAPMHPGHPGHPPPHLAINMGPPPPPQQQPQLHIPNGPQARGPLPQQYNLQQIRDQSRLTHPQLAQQMTQQIQNQMQHHKGRQPLGGAQMKHAMMQKSLQAAAMRNNPQPNQKLQQQRLPMPPQVLAMNGSCSAAQMQMMKANMQNQQPQLQQIQQQQQISQQQQNSNVIPIQQMPNINRQQTHQQLQHRQPLPPNHQKHNGNNRSRSHNRQSQQNPMHPRQILQNPNRVNHLHKANVSTPTTLPTVSEVESTVVCTAQRTDELSPTAEDFKPQSNQKPSEGEKAEEEDNGLLNDFLSVVMKGENCFTNSKEKTPMCLVNELARYNKIEHQYRLTSESGPAHCKRFTVTLKLGTEEYTAEGYKIKKAQHTAAAEAIKKTKYKHPLPKIIRRPEESLRATITPTVELNALAMKLGQQTYYVFDPRSQQEATPGSQDMPANERVSRAGMLPQQQRFIAGKVYPPKYPMRIPSVNGYAPMPGHIPNGVPAELCKITLIVGKQKFVGCGKTLQAAKHDAASRALQVLKTQAATKFKEILSRTSEDGDWKSPISLVHEIAIKRNLNVVFKVLREEGPAHMKNFITTCEVGNIITEGDGNGKKISKKHAAEKMLEELKKLPPPSPSKSPPVKRIKVKSFKRKTSPSTKKRGSSSIRDKSDVEYAEETNPISKLIQIQQSRNEKGPVYELIARNGETKKKEFVMEVNVPGKVARGIGASKKLAKRSAAQNLLIAMGVETEDNDNQENDSQIANQNSTAKAARKVKFNESSETTDRPSDTSAASQNGNGGPSGRQIVPGVLLLRQHSKDSDEADHSAEAGDHSRKEQPSTTSATTASEKCATTTTTTSSSSSSSNVTGVRPKDQLMYLAQILGFQVNYSDYPKGNHNEFLTIVTLSTSPPQICHGMGLNVEESQDQAASATLQILSKLGLDNVKPKTED